MNISKAVFEYLSARRPELNSSTRQIDRCILFDLAAAIGDKSTLPQGLTGRRIEKWRASKTHWGPATHARNLSRVRQFCKWLVLRGYLKKDPTVGMKAPRLPLSVPRAMAPHEITSILAACPDERARLMVLLMVQEGLRALEVGAIHTADIDYGERTLLVHGKGRKERLIPMSDQTWEALEDWLRVRGNRAGPLICSYTTGENLRPQTVSAMLSRWMYDAGVKQAPRDGKSGHALRHTALSDMVRRGFDQGKVDAALGDLFAAVMTPGFDPDDMRGKFLAMAETLGARATLLDIQRAAGHTSIETTRRYLPHAVADLRKVMGGRQYGAEPLAPVGADSD